MNVNRTRLRVVMITAIIAILAESATHAALDLLPDDTGSYAVLYEGSGNNTLTVNSSPVNGSSVFGNIGLGTQNGGNPKFVLNNPAVINGNVNFAAATPNFSNGGTLNGSVNAGVSQVNTDLINLNALSQNLGALPGTSVAISGNTTISASSGVFNNTVDSFIFNLTALSFGNSSTLTIDGQGFDANVVININRALISGPQFAGTINLIGGLSPNNFIINLTGGNYTTLSGGPTLQTAANRNTQNVTYLNPTGKINVNAVNIFGHLFGGDTTDMMVVSGATVTIPEPGTIALAALGGLSMIVPRRRLCGKTQ